MGNRIIDEKKLELLLIKEIRYGLLVNNGLTLTKLWDQVQVNNPMGNIYREVEKIMNRYEKI